MRKLLFLILVLSLNLYGANVSLQTIGNNADVISSPLRNNFNILQNAFNKGINASNITNGSISYDLLGKPLLTNSTEFNATVSDNSINLSKANTDWFSVNLPIYKKTGVGLDIKLSGTYFDTTTLPGTVDLKDDGIASDKIDVSSFDGNGLSSDTSNDVLDINVDNVSILIENDSLVLGRINISGDTSVEEDTNLNYAIQTGGETLLTNDTSSLINAINSNKEYVDGLGITSANNSNDVFRNLYIDDTTILSIIAPQSGTGDFDTIYLEGQSDTYSNWDLLIWCRDEGDFRTPDYILFKLALCDSDLSVLMDYDEFAGYYNLNSVTGSNNITSVSNQTSQEIIGLQHTNNEVAGGITVNAYLGDSDEAHKIYVKVKLPIKYSTYNNLKLKVTLNGFSASGGYSTPRVYFMK